MHGRYLELMLAINENGFSGDVQNEMSTSIPKVGSGRSVKAIGGGAEKIAAIEGAEDMRFSLNRVDNSRSDGDADEFTEEGGSVIMLDEVLDLLSRMWSSGTQMRKHDCRLMKHLRVYSLV
ncbi:vacuolar sorting protein 39 [Manihot esculenta]|uniref:vacuolar sorting protein 39 n=1 Tax=Manihot esculenta TaxID=3983 RepID=UPI001CC7F615|nr:vacuolar sorting protein 39 [Manihot esculenta]